MAGSGESQPATGEGAGSKRSQKATEHHVSENLSVHSGRTGGDEDKDSNHAKSRQSNNKSRSGSEPAQRQSEPNEDYADQQNPAKSGSKTRSKKAKGSSKGKSSDKQNSKGPKSQALSKGRQGAMDPRYSSLDVDVANDGSEKPRLATNSSAGSLSAKALKTTGFKAESKEPKDTSKDESRTRSIGSVRSPGSKKKTKKKVGAQT